MNQEIPEVLDWVSERAGCTPSVVMEMLRNQVDGDIQKRNMIGPQHGFPKRNFVLQGEANWFAVLQQRFPEGPKGILFYLTATGISVKDAESKRDLYNAVLRLSDEGKCRLKVGSSEYNLWQFRKLALHDLFFVDQEMLLA